jgi:uncharacterized protein (TIGR01244 family)
VRKIYFFCVIACAAFALPAWAANIELAGVANFHQVNQNLYRGAQPTDEGLKNLADLGVRTIVDLRHGKEHSNAEQKEAESFGLHYVSVPMEGLNAPTDQQVATFMAVLNASDEGPVFVHCREGKDRTGAVIASYRIAHDHWSNDRALQEAKTYGLHRGQHPRENFILNFETPASGVQSSTGAPAPQLLPVA